MAEQLEQERRLTGDATAKTLFREMWFIPGNRKRALISVILMICQQMTGTNAVNYYAPQIFNNLGMTGTDTSLFATGVYGVVKTTGCAIFLTFVADSLGRRRSLLWTSCAMFVVMYIIGIYGRTNPPVEGEPVSGIGQSEERRMLLTNTSVRSLRLDTSPLPVSTSMLRKYCWLCPVSLTIRSSTTAQILPVRLGSSLLDHCQ